MKHEQELADGDFAPSYAPCIRCGEPTQVHDGIGGNQSIRKGWRELVPPAIGWGK